MAVDRSARLVPPIPYKTPLNDARGFVTEPWSKFFRQLFLRIGGADALSNSELEELSVTDLETLKTQVTQLQTSLQASQATIAQLSGFVDGLNQGPRL